jgi:hypothetical protein
VVLKFGHFGQYLRITRKVLKCNAEEWWTMPFGDQCEKRRSIIYSKAGEEIPHTIESRKAN